MGPHLLKILISSGGSKLKTEPQVPGADLEYITPAPLDFGFALISSLLSILPILVFRMGVFTLLLYLTAKSWPKSQRTCDTLGKH